MYIYVSRMARTGTCTYLYVLCLTWVRGPIGTPLVHAPVGNRLGAIRDEGVAIRFLATPS